MLAHNRYFRSSRITVFYSYFQLISPSTTMEPTASSRAGQSLIHLRPTSAMSSDPDRSSEDTAADDTSPASERPQGPDAEGSPDPVSAPTATATTPGENRDDNMEPTDAVPADAERAEVRSDGAPINARLADASGISKWVAWLLTCLGLALPFLVMANDRRWVFSVYVGVLGCGAASFGLMRLLGGWKADERELAPTKNHAELVALLGASIVAFVFATRGAVAGIYPLQPVAAGVLISATFIWIVIASFNLASAIGLYKPAEGEPASLWQRHGFWLIAAVTVLYLPGLGSFGLIDPWETHYGEVAREMIARDDWISLWWAQDGWFWSKPILNFWIQALSFKVFGLHYMPDQMLSGITQGHVPQPEWACRIPIFLMTVTAAYALYRATIAPFGRRGALLGGLVLATCPYWYILARQTMADMPYVAPLCVAMALLMLGFQTDPDERVANYTLRLGRFRCTLNAFHLIFGLTLLCVLPQVLYLFSRNLTFHTTELFGFRPHLDEILRGSGGGNCGQPGNKKCTEVGALYAWGQPALWAVLWLGLSLGVLFWRRKERRAQRLYFIAAWLCTAVAVMAKGAPGLVLPVGAAFVFAVVSGRFRDLLRLELAVFLILLLAVALPWYVQMYMRHGYPFFNRLVLHDMVKRAFDQVHSTNEGDDISFRYYVWQLGYGLFPWTGLCAGGLLWWSTLKRRAGDLSDKLRGECVHFLLIWWLLAFGMFSVTLTKFHHYILPLVPPTAMLCGLFLTRFAPDVLPSRRSHKWLYPASLFVGLGLLFLGLVAYLPGNLDAEIVPDAGEPPAQRLLGVVLCSVGFGLVALGILRFGKELHSQDEPSALTPAQSLLAIGSTLAVALAGRDMVVTRKGDIEGPSRIMHLFTYNYGRPYPETLDFSPALLALTVLAAVCCLLMAAPRIRRHASVMMMCMGGVVGIWCMGVYLNQLAPHWGQRETMLAYYQHRDNPKQELVAYQMNWKGENFYTGNRMATFVSTGKKFKDWVKKERKKGIDTMFFTTEHTRKRTLKRELGNPDGFEQLTDETLNNKFFVAKVEFGPLSEDEPSKKPKKSDKRTKPNER